MMTVRILVDFDGVLHSYTSGWKGATEIPDPPIVDPESGDDAISWLADLSESDDFEVLVYSSRSKEPGGIEAMREWFVRYQLPREALERIYFPTEKPAAHLTIDDRAICFTGRFPSRERLLAFRPWNKRRKISPSFRADVRVRDRLDQEHIELTTHGPTGLLRVEVEALSGNAPPGRIPRAAILLAPSRVRELRDALEEWLLGGAG